MDQGNVSFVVNSTCVGNENRLVDCQYTVVYNCSQNEDAAISCKDECEFNCVLSYFSIRYNKYTPSGKINKKKVMNVETSYKSHVYVQCFSVFFPSLRGPPEV